jgi:hypothetical protein
VALDILSLVRFWCPFYRGKITKKKANGLITKIINIFGRERKLLARTAMPNTEPQRHVYFGITTRLRNLACFEARRIKRNIKQ